MSRKQWIVTAGLITLALTGTTPPIAAQPAPAGQRPRIEINPRPLLHRRCASWYVVQYRPRGRVLFPEKHCWWERG
jgi:hypothetical protein